MAEKTWTKDAEREQLRKIAELIEETEANSYIRFAFAGCVKMAEENIEYDFANSYPDLIEFKDKQISEFRRDAEGMQERIKELEQAKKDAREYRASAESVIDNMQEEITGWKNKFSDAVSLADEWENNAHDMANQLSHKDAEIQRLKAELYDYMRKERETNA